MELAQSKEEHDMLVEQMTRLKEDVVEEIASLQRSYEVCLCTLQVLSHFLHTTCMQHLSMTEAESCIVSMARSYC